MNPFFSIITINYNNCEGLRRTIKSVFSQTCRDFEYLIVDGGSTDGSMQVIEQHRDSLSFWCSESDRGIYNAMNKGVVHANGEYVCFLNSGDEFFSPDVLESLQRFGLDGDIIIGKVFCGGKKYLNSYDLSDFVQLCGDGICHQGTFTKKQLLSGNPFDEELRIVSDWKFWLQTIILAGVEPTYIDLTIAKYDAGGISSTAIDMVLKEREKVLDSLFPPVISKGMQNCCEIVQNPVFKNMSYLKTHHYFLYVFLKKIISLVYRLFCH